MKALLAATAIAAACASFGSSGASAAEPVSPAQRLRESDALFQATQYFDAARYAFEAAEEDSGLRAEAYSRVAVGLSRAGLYNSATYFFIKTLQTNERAPIRRVLAEAQNLLIHVGGDLLRPYLIRHTKYEDYDPINRAAYLYSLAKDAVLQEANDRAVGYVNGISSQSALWPYALHLRATAYALADKNPEALRDFRDCQARAHEYPVKRDADDLRARCIAGEARVLYQMEQFEDADRTYDRIPKASFVWPDILFEQAWNSFGKREYNRTLGKLVSYKSPALKFVFNTEVDVLTAQSYLALCLYGDANDVINEFNAKYKKVGEDVKHFVENNSSDLNAFYDRGKEALTAPLYTPNEFYRMENRFVRGPYFQNLVASERDTGIELAGVRRFAASVGRGRGVSQGFPAFLGQVLGWRVHTIRLLGGAFVKNSLMDYHAALVSDFEKMAFIKLEMLKRAKDTLLHRPHPMDRSWGAREPNRRDDQYYWSFNGEFWNDELGDYVFGLESQCKASDGA